MAVYYNQATRNARMTEVLDAIDAGTAADHATIEIGTGSGMALGTKLAEIELNFPSFTLATATSQLNMSVTPSAPEVASAATGGTANVARIVAGNGTVVVFGLTVGDSTFPGPGSPDLTLNSVQISGGQTVTITSGTITHSHNTAAATP